MDYQEVLNSQEIFSNELQMFSKKEMQKEVSLIVIFEFFLIRQKNGTTGFETFRGIQRIQDC